ncbi:unnamed protein product, partial [Scytosiphon promiscuus]
AHFCFFLPNYTYITRARLCTRNRPSLHHARWPQNQRCERLPFHPRTGDRFWKRLSELACSCNDRSLTTSTNVGGCATYSDQSGKELTGQEPQRLSR